MRLVIAAILWACVVGWAQADPDLKAGEAKALDKCENCHGGGNDAEGDDLAGTPAEKFIKAMNEYKARTRKHGGMRKRASELTDQDIENLAAYYSAKPVKTKK
jgi:cytochrome c553